MRFRRLFFLALFLMVPAATAFGGIISEVGGDDMSGMIVTVVYADPEKPQSETTWNSISSNYGGAIFNQDWQLTFDGHDTFWSPLADKYVWLFSSIYPVKSIIIDALAGGVVFDIFYAQGGLNDTPESLQGYWQGNETSGTAYKGTGGSYDWEFLNPFGSYGDLYGKLIITFPTTASQKSFRFELDTDLVVPEPSTIFLMGMGLLCLARIRPKR